jgi:hypothetical protein
VPYLELLKRQLSELGLELNQNKTEIGSLHDGFDFLGIRWTVNENGVELAPTADRVWNFRGQVRNTIRRTYRWGAKNDVIAAVGRLLDRRTQYLRQVGANDGQLCQEAMDQLTAFVHRVWPSEYLRKRLWRYRSDFRSWQAQQTG